MNQEPERIRRGDQVFLWRNTGNGKFGPPGIIAECVADSEAEKMTEELSMLPFWRVPETYTYRYRIWITVEKGES